MRTIDPTWRDLAKGYHTIVAHEATLRAELIPRLEQAQQARYRAELHEWTARRELRYAHFQNALTAWRQVASAQRSRIRDTADADGRRACFIVPAACIIFLAVAMATAESSLAGVLQWLLLAGAVGGIISFARTAWWGFQYFSLKSKEPRWSEEPQPRPEAVPELSLLDQWWQVVANGTNQSSANTQHGEEGEQNFYHYLASTLPDSYIGCRGLLVARSLDADVILISPAAVWIFEVKHWSGVIMCRNGSWSRTKVYYAPGGRRVNEETEIPEAFDNQWIRERREVASTIRRRTRFPHLADNLDGGLVFTHPAVELNVDYSKCPYGDSQFWGARLREAKARRQATLTVPDQLEVVDALLDQAEQVERRHIGRRSSIELADQIARNTIFQAAKYIRRCASR